MFSHNKRYRANRMRYGEDRDQEDSRDVEGVWGELFGSSPAIGGGSTDGEAVGGTGETTLGICALAGSEAAVDGTEAARESAVRGDGEAGGGVAGSHGLLPGEAGGVSPGARLEGLTIDDTPLSEEVRPGSAQHQTAEASIPERPGNATP